MQTFRYIWEKNVFQDDETGKIIPKKVDVLIFIIFLILIFSNGFEMLVFLFYKYIELLTLPALKV